MSAFIFHGLGGNPQENWIPWCVTLENGKQLAKNLGVELTFVPNAGHFNKKAGYLEFQELKKKITEIIK